MLKDKYQSLTIHQRHLIWTCLAIFVSALVSRLALGFIIRLPLSIHFAEIELIARSLAEHNAFADPYAVPTGLTAHTSPVYPFLLSLIFRVAGYGSVAFLLMAGVNMLFVAAHYALLPVLAEELSLPRHVGTAAGLFGALLPFRFLKETAWDSPLVALTFVLLIILSARWLRRSEPDWRKTIELGLAWGAAFMISALFLPVALTFGGLSWLFSRRGERTRRLTHCVLALVVSLLVVVPWTVRNYRALGGLIFIRDNFGTEFDLSNHDLAYPLLRDNIVTVPGNYFHQHSPYSSIPVASQLAAEGEIPYNKRKLQEGLRWSREHPDRFSRLMALRILNFWWMPSIDQIAKDLLIVPTMLLAWAGLFLLWRQDRRAALLFLAVWIAYPLPYYFIQVDTRYRYPMDWTFYFLASFAVFYWLRSRGIFKDEARYGLSGKLPVT